MFHSKWLMGWRCLAIAGLLCATLGRAAEYHLFARSNLVAWCIVPFDAKKRGPEERAAMLKQLGITKLAYDYRAEHIPTFDAEMLALKRHGIEMTAWWFPTVLNDEARQILAVLKRHHARAQLWVTGGGSATKSPEEQTARVQGEAARIRPIAEAAAAQGCRVALYNHGGWFGEPENQIAVIERLRSQGVTNVGIVYNQHHGHAHIDRFAEMLARMKPYLLALNLNGMVRDGESTGRKIMPLGQGDRDLGLLKVVRDSGWQGPIGLLNHTDEDAEARLRDNLDGLDWLVAQLEEKPAGAKPTPRSWRDPLKKASAKKDYWAVEDRAARERLPLYKTIPAARPDELTPAQPLNPEMFREWRRSFGENGSARYSSLKQINRSNVAQLQVAWTYRSKDGVGNIQANPIVVNGLMIVPTPGRHVVAVNATNGHEVWRFKPEGRPAFRGLTFWLGRDNAQPRLFFPSGRLLYALGLDGKPIPEFGEQGRVTLPARGQGDFGASTVAPVVHERTVILAGWEKDVWAFDAVTGERRWTFHTVPRAGEFGAETWDQPQPYGANCWGGMALDEARGIVFITTGSPKPNFVGVTHHGDNLFANCVIAINARTGERLWHFQEIPHDIWDLDIPAAPNLVTITREGRRIDAVAAVTKIGNTLLLDRVSGKPIFPFRMRRAPTSLLPGEVTAPYQPDVELPEPFAKQEFTMEDITDRSEEATENVTARVKGATIGWFEPFREGKPNLFLGLHGGAEWTGSCVDPFAGKLYVSGNNIPWIITVFRDDDPRDEPKVPTRGKLVYQQRCANCHGENRVGAGTCPPLRGLRHRLRDDEVAHVLKTGRNSMPGQPDISAEDLKALTDFLMLRDRSFTEPTKPERPVYSHNGYPKFLDHEGYPATKPPWGTLNCIDLNTGKLEWQVPLGEYEELTREGIKKTGTENFGGAICTAGGVVFCAGTRDSRIRAFDSRTGAELWSHGLPFVGSAPPTTYEESGKQYVVIPATGGGKLGTTPGDAFVAFALP
jgi:quinoprotein glucose dehydrogenase